MIKYLFGAAAASVGLVYAGSMKWLKIAHVYIRSDKLSKGGRIRILHLSDLHGNSDSVQNIDIWKKINRLDFDFAVITGDLIQDYADELNPHIGMLEKLAKRTKVYYVDGNHEKYVYADVCERLKQAGVTVLCNEQIEIDVNGCHLKIIGVRDLYWQIKNMKGKKSNWKKYLDALFTCSRNHANVFTLLLSHQPQIIEYLKNNKPDLILCGHTHGGQLRLPGFPAIYAPGQGFFPRYSDGLYNTKNGMLYISRGIGATNFRVRFFNRPEITVLEVFA